MAYLLLAKIPLSLLIGLTALFGFVLQRRDMGIDSFLCFAVVFALAAGGGTLNNIQDTLFDAGLSRTRNRPLPRGAVSRPVAALQAALLIGAGLLALKLLTPGSNLPLFGGIASLFLYNAVYTPLKKRTVLAIIPGAACGMLPPLLGWLVAGNQPPGLEIITAMCLVGLWQLPHFWLILLYHNQDYAASGTRTMLSLFSEQQVRRILLSWVLAFAVATLFLPFCGIITAPAATTILLGNAACLCVYFTCRCLRQAMVPAPVYRRLFLHLNSAFIVVILLGIIANT